MKLLAKTAYRIAYQEYERNPNDKGKTIALGGPLGLGPVGYVTYVILV